MNGNFNVTPIKKPNVSEELKKYTYDKQTIDDAIDSLDSDFTTLNEKFTDLKKVVETQKADKTEIPRPLWLADSVTLSDAGVSGIYTINKRNIMPLVATGYTIMAGDKIMIQTDEAWYTCVVMSVTDSSVTATPKFDAASKEYVERLIINTLNTPV